MAANAGETKVKLWEGICYPENMLDDWQEEIDDILQVPFAYAIHDIDHDQKSKQRKTLCSHHRGLGRQHDPQGDNQRPEPLERGRQEVLLLCGASHNIRHAYDYLILRHDIVPKEGQGTVPSRRPAFEGN